MLVLDHLLRTSAAAGEWHSARLPAANSDRRAIEVVVAVPVLGTINAATLQPILLDPINEILLVCVLAIVANEGLESLGGLVFDLEKANLSNGWLE